jgi:glycosyltransferase involved in cell wall biosynthesis
MKHVVQLIPSLDRIGGAERQILLLAHGLLRRGWRVSVVTLAGEGGGAELRAAGAAFFNLEMRHGLADPGGWLRWRTWLRGAAPEVVHAHLTHAAWLARWSRLSAPTPVLIDTLHSSWTGSWGRRIGYRMSRWLPDQVTAVSEGVAAAHLGAAMVDPSRITILPNGVDANFWRPEPGARAGVRRELGLGAEFLWLSAGRLDPVKDFSSLLRAFAGIEASARLVIAGAGPGESGLRRLCTELGLDPRVRFLGFETDLLRWMQGADGFVLSSRWEGLPMTLLEAAACALPAVATDVAGSNEVVAHQETGLLAAAGSVEALRETMRRLMETPEQERSALGLRARQRVIERYALEAVLDRWEALYNALLSRNGRPRRWGGTSEQH